MTTCTNELNAVEFVEDYESKDLSRDAIIKGFQHLIDSGLCWKLQGHYGRMARSLIDSEHCRELG